MHKNMQQHACMQMGGAVDLVVKVSASDRVKTSDEAKPIRISAVKASDPK